MKKINDCYVNQHSCFLLQYHLVIVTKYRHPVIDNELKVSLIEYTNNYFKERNCNILGINTDKDHIHIVFEAYPNFNLANFINAYKSASSRMMRRDYSDFLKLYYCKPCFWSQSYFVSTVSERSTKLVQEYVKNQDIC